MAEAALQSATVCTITNPSLSDGLIVEIGRNDCVLGLAGPMTFIVIMYGMSRLMPSARVCAWRRWQEVDRRGGGALGGGRREVAALSDHTMMRDARCCDFILHTTQGALSLISDQNQSLAPGSS